MFSGCIATVMAFHGEYGWVVFWVIIAAIFDFCDGFAARLLKAHSSIGKDLDSLADMISFGLVPGMILFRLLSDNVHIISDNELVREYLPYMAFVMTVFSALRLAKFNVDTRQTESFIGLNTPANTLFWVSFCYSLMTKSYIVLSSGIIYTVMVGIVAFSLLLVSEIPMFSLKIKSLKFKGNEYRYLLAAAIIVSVGLLDVLGISVGILLYIALSIALSKKKTESESQ